MYDNIDGHDLFAVNNVYRTNVMHENMEFHVLFAVYNVYWPIV